jgi:hypothetical protein
MNPIGITKNSEYQTIEGMARPNLGARHPFFDGGETAAVTTYQPPAFAFTLL